MIQKTIQKIIFIFIKIFTSYWGSFLNEVVVLQEGVSLLRDVDGPGLPRRLHLVGQGYVIGPE